MRFQVRNPTYANGMIECLLCNEKFYSGSLPGLMNWQREHRCAPKPIEPVQLVLPITEGT